MNENLIKEARRKFGFFFSKIRTENKLTQQQVGDFCGVSAKTIDKIERGQFPYSIDLLFKLSVILGFTINFEAKEYGLVNEGRFLLQKSEIENTYVVTDILNQIVCTFELKKFNETQKFTFLNDKKHTEIELATIMREIGNWIFQNHREVI